MLGMIISRLVPVEQWGTHLSRSIEPICQVTKRVQIVRDFVDSIREVPLAEALCLIPAEEALDLWVITSRRSFEAELTISEAFAELLRRYPEVNLDFLILPREGRRLEDFLPRNSIIVWRRGEESTP